MFICFSTSQSSVLGRQDDGIARNRSLKFDVCARSHTVLGLRVRVKTKISYFYSFRYAWCWLRVLRWTVVVCWWSALGYPPQLMTDPRTSGGRVPSKQALFRSLWWECVALAGRSGSAAAGLRAKKNFVPRGHVGSSRVPRSCRVLDGIARWERVVQLWVIWAHHWRSYSGVKWI
jgi:hypothetical protein